jgi:hypothetical protein
VPVICSTGLLALLVASCASQPSPAQLTMAPAPHTELATASRVIDGRGRFRQIFCGLLARRGDVGTDPADCRRFLWRLDDEPVVPLGPLPVPDPALRVYLVSGSFSECLGEDGMPFRLAAESLAELAPEVVAEVERTLRELVGNGARRGGFTITTTIGVIAMVVVAFVPRPSPGGCTTACGAACLAGLASRS